MVLALVLIVVPGKESFAALIRGTVLRPVFALQRGSVDRGSRVADPVRLRAERDSLAAFLVGTGGLGEENRQLRALLGLRERLPASFVPAELTRVPGRALDGLFLLTAGAAEGVRDGSPIVAPGGLVGKVRKVDAGTAEGMDWTHPDFGASAMTADGDAYGLVAGHVGENGEQMLVLSGIAFHTELENGTLIVTAGRGGGYPRGIPIGTVVGSEAPDGGWSKGYLLKPMVSPAEMSSVLVLGQPDPSLAGRDLSASWGIRPAAESVDSLPAALSRRSPEAAIQAGAAVAPAQPSLAQPAAARPSAPRPTPTNRIRVPNVSPSASGRAAPTIVSPRSGGGTLSPDTSFRREGE